MSNTPYTGSKAQVLAGAVFNYLGPVTAPVSAISIGEVTTSSFSGAKTDTVPVTNFNSGQQQEIQATVIDPGMLEITYNRVSSDAGQTALYQAFVNRTLCSFSVQLPINTLAGQATTGDLVTFNAYVTEGPTNFSLDFTKQSECKVTLKLSKLPTLTEGS